MGDTRKSLEHHEHALDIAHTIEDRSGESNALGNLGVIYFNLGQFHKAIEYYLP